MSRPQPDGPTGPTAARTYDSSRRQAEASDRRARVVDAARQLFLARGYGATSIAAIAEAAGVSGPTVYAQFDSKAGILARVIGAAIAGDHAEQGLARERPDIAVVLSPDLEPRTRLAEMARVARVVHERSAQLIALVESVAGTDEAVAELARSLRDGARADAQVAARTFAPGDLRAGVDTDTAADILWTVAGAGTYIMLVDQLGRTPDAYQQWLEQRLVNLLLDDEQPTRRPPR